MLSAFIEDGYTQKFYLEGVVGIYPDVRGTFRPLLREEIEQHSQAMTGKKPAERVAYIGTILADKLKSWNLTAEINAERLAHLKPALRDELERLVWGFSAGDCDPTWPEAERNAWKGLAGEAKGDGSDGPRVIGELRESADAKN